jgi:hypothetical protein
LVQQVGGELEAPEVAAQRAGEGAREQRLADAGHVFEQDVAFDEQGDEQQLDRRRLAHHHGLHRSGQQLRRLADVHCRSCRACLASRSC